MVKNLEFIPCGIEQIIDGQDNTPFLQSDWVCEILRNYPGTVTSRVANLIFMAGYLTKEKEIIMGNYKELMELGGADG